MNLLKASPQPPAHPNEPILDPVSREEQERLLAILNFWHKLEFFIPLDLDGRINEAEEGRIQWLQSSYLAQSPGNLWLAALDDKYELKGFLLYIGVFDKSDITRICEQSVRSRSEISAYEDFERTDLDGKTCFARLKISTTGEMIFDSKPDTISISTVPWALGQLQAGDFPTLTHGHFEQAKEKLGQLLQNFHSIHQGKSLAGGDILALHQLFVEWAQYSPPRSEVIAVRQVLASKKKEARKVQESKSEAESVEESEDVEEVEPEIGILNSFFIRDLERAAATLQSGFCPAGLKSYLTPVMSSQRVDLESDEGCRAVLEALHPKRLNRGHWFSKPSYPMSLMQQFAINSAISTANAQPLFSVNGPPGTGKTTLLKDIFAELVVRRARVLSGMRKPSDAFETKRISVEFSGDSDRVSIVRLKPELTGFEMVVASSNNAAVENISHELPKIETSIRVHWPAAAYFQTVAHKLAAQLDEGNFRKLPDEDCPWGLVSCALGKSANRRRFKERFAFMRVRPDSKPDWSGSSRPQTIYEWIDSYRGLSFAEAAATFKAIERQVETRCDRLGQYADLFSQNFKSSKANEVSLARERMHNCRAELGRIESELIDLEHAISKQQQSLSALQEDERLIDRSAPGWWAKLLRTPGARRHRSRERENSLAQLAARQQLSVLTGNKTALQQTQKNVSRGAAQADEGLKRAEDVQASNQLRWSELQKEFASHKLPASPTDLDTGYFQQEGLWHDEELANLRSSLFAAALTLHEAWLAEVAKNKAHGGAGFRANIVAVTKLLSNKRLSDNSAAIPIWQSLFMIVPVVSSTFASFANQFSDLGPASLGWLFIDEAGQAVPQAAAGALWRAQQALVVGDPRQIEPIFTLPSRFIATLAGLSPHTSDGSYSPHLTSVQGLADNANRYGAYLSGEDGSVWVGSPLRVHRRCIEPMFRWSNEIAYDNKMVFGLPLRELPDGPPLRCESIWIDVKGKVRKRQEVPEQTQFVTELLVTLYQAEGKLPDLYVISPFKACKNELKKTLTAVDWTQGRPDLPRLKKRELTKWLKERVGTVHTFQGKEEDSVIMVLGADREHAGAAEWASSKPNILNVALTRAKRRFYVVGDRELWGAMGSFRPSAELLNSISAEEFLRSLQIRNNLSRSAGTG